MDFGAIQLAVGSLKAAFDMTKKFLEMKSTAEVQGLVIALQGEILSAQGSALAAQSDQAAMAEMVRELKEEVARMKAWEREKQRYALTVIMIGAVAYALKEECKGTEPPHWICTKCYEDGFKSILNPRSNAKQLYSYCCPRCHSEINSDFCRPLAPKYVST